MLAIFVLFTILKLGTTRTNTILSSYAQYEGLMDEMRFWGSTTCQAGRRRTFSLHETYRTSSTRHLRDFFEALITNMQTECRSTMKTKFYLVDDVTNDTNPFNTLHGNESVTSHLDILQESGDIGTASAREIHLFPYKDVEIVLLMLENSARTLMEGNIFDDFNNRRHVLVLMVSEEKNRQQSAESLKNAIAVLLQRLWHERGILNVFFAAPFSSLGCRIWFYDPFFKNATTGVRGKIFALGVASIPAVDRVKDLNGYTLNIGMFEAAPAAIKFDSTSTQNLFAFAHKSQGFGGIDGLTMAAIAERMNFELNILPPTDGVEFGYVCINGTVVGTIGDAANHRIDIGFNSMYAKLYTTNTESNIIELTVPIDFDRLCLIVPRARKVPRWLKTFYYFDPAIWGCLLLTEIIISLVWYILRKFRESPRENLRRTTSYHTLLLDTFLLFVGAPLKLNTSQAERMVLSALLLLGVTVMGMFTGTLYHSFTQEMHYKDMNTLKEVDTAGIDVGTASPNLRDVFGTEDTKDETEEIKSLRRKFKILDYDGMPTIQKTAYERNIASLSREHSFLVVMYRYVDDSGTKLLHLVDECPRSYYLSYVVPKDSVYIDRLNELISRLKEAGLPPLWDSVTTNKLVVEENAKAQLKKVRSRHTSFNINDMQTSFILLLIGYVMSIVVLIGEVCFNRKKQRGIKIRHKICGKSVQYNCIYL